MKLQAKKANLVKKKKEEKSLDLFDIRTAQSSTDTPSHLHLMISQGCLEVAANNALSLSSAVESTFLCPAACDIFGFLAVCGYCFRPMGLVTHTVA